MAGRTQSQAQPLLKHLRWWQTEGSCYNDSKIENLIAGRQHEHIHVCMRSLRIETLSYLNLSNNTPYG